jgi:hypothetical protein
MSIVTMTQTAEMPQLDRVRDTMSFSNILTPSTTLAATPDVTGDAPVIASPSTPKKAATSVGEGVGSPDSAMSDSAIAEGNDDSTEDDAQDVPDADREFICKNDMGSRCVTGQYTMELSRKVISDHFGRNKACTRDITDWPLFCRKHYQRATYNKELWQIRKLNLIHRQFDVIEAEFPGTTYDILFKKSEEARLNAYSRKIASGVTEQQAARAVAPQAGKHFEAPIAILRELDLDLGKNKTMEEVKEVTEKILKQITDGATDQVPSIEFLPNLPGKIVSPKKGPKTPTPKKARTPKTPKSRGTPKSKGTPKTPKSKSNPDRVSAKGSIKKPSHKA